MNRGEDRISPSNYPNAFSTILLQDAIYIFTLLLVFKRFIAKLLSLYRVKSDMLTVNSVEPIFCSNLYCTHIYRRYILCSLVCIYSSCRGFSIIILVWNKISSRVLVCICFVCLYVCGERKRERERGRKRAMVRVCIYLKSGSQSACNMREKYYFLILQRETAISEAWRGSYDSLYEIPPQTRCEQGELAFSSIESTSHCIVLTCFQCKSFHKLDSDTPDKEKRTIERRRE